MAFTPEIRLKIIKIFEKLRESGLTDDEIASLVKLKILRRTQNTTKMEEK